MFGYLLLLVLVGLLLGLPLVKTLLVLGWRGCQVLILKVFVGNGFRLIIFVDSVVSSDVSDHPDVWTDGSFVRDELSGVGAGGCGTNDSQHGESVLARADDATNSGGRTPGSKLPASPPPLPRPDGGGQPLAVYLCTRPKKPTHQPTNSICGAAQQGDRPPVVAAPLRPLPESSCSCRRKNRHCS